MNNVMVIITTIGVTVGVLGIIFGFAMARKKKIPVGEILNTANDIINTAGAVINEADKLLPGNKVITILQLIEKWTKYGVGNAEQLYHSGELDADQRLKTAQQVVYTALAQFGITPTEDQQLLINAAIQHEVNALGHSDVSTETTPLAKANQA
jgi:hypothetical protein